MKLLKTLSIGIFASLCVSTTNAQDLAPSLLNGNFVDDYGIKYTINDTLWIQHPGIKYHIVKWNIKEQYLIAKNGNGHKVDENKYTRIDFMTFEGMAPWHWGFCLTAYKAKTDVEAEQTAAADRKDPKKGCNGFPFSRMKVASEQ
ncbi:hypothetical protein [Pedobacter helvus]|uniref:Uncharacterized protein n=1 Tax=Pedobacter helvus TaxID=2563444 RepID=A0ABW9JJV1_9SPHI|nr:hypothetical protein [Pedobacter ureilyticus]